jgi:putative FmdB family regulatory protein
MPLYSWTCHECGRREEKLQTWAEAQEAQWCPSCGGQMDLTPGAPAWFRPGKFGKGGGLKHDVR